MRKFIRTLKRTSWHIPGRTGRVDISKARAALIDEPGKWNLALTERELRPEDPVTADYIRWLKEIPLEQRAEAVERDSQNVTKADLVTICENPLPVT